VDILCCELPIKVSFGKPAFKKNSPRYVFFLRERERDRGREREREKESEFSSPSAGQGSFARPLGKGLETQISFLPHLRGKILRSSLFGVQGIMLEEAKNIFWGKVGSTTE
jgi:hypothetical protein